MRHPHEIARDPASGAWLQTTLTLRRIDGVQVPFQNGIPVPSFDPQERRTVPLRGTWKKIRFAADHDFSMSPRNPAWLDRLEATEGAYLRGRSDDGWRDHDVPLPENRLSGQERAGAAETYEDGVWYRRTFRLDRPDGTKAYTLKALGVNYVADFWINGRWIGYHEGGFTPFAFDVTPFLREGENEIRVRIDNPPWGSRHDTIPAVAGTDFFNYTGIVQDLYLEEHSRVHIVRADIVPLDTDGLLRIRVVVENRGPEDETVTVDGELFEAIRDIPGLLASPAASSIKDRPAATDRPLAARLAIGAGQVRALTFEVRVERPKLWSVGKPHLYVAEFRVSGGNGGSAAGAAADVFSTQFGIRTVRTEGTKLLLNGRPLLLAGIARHEEWPDTGRTADWARIRQDLLQIRTMNANLVRTGHYPNHVYTYLLLDRLGMAAMSEIPLWQLETAHFQVLNERKLPDQMWREMVFSQYNRPSVLLWSTQNECNDAALRLAYNRRIVRDLRENYDDGRLVTQSAAADRPGPDDPSMEPLDVAGWTMYFGTFHGGTAYEGTRAFLEQAHRAFPDKPILNTEFGHWTGETDAEEHKQLETYADTLRALLEKAAVSPSGQANEDGYLVGFDFWIMYNWYVNHNQWVDTFGVFHMDRAREKRVAGRIRRDYRYILGERSGLASPEPSVPRFRTLWESGGLPAALDGQGCWRLAWDSPVDASLYPFVQIDVEVHGEDAACRVALKDAGQRAWSVQTGKMPAGTRYPVYVPMWEAEGLDVRRLTSLAVQADAGRKLFIRSVRLTLSGAEPCTPLAE